MTNNQKQKLVKNKTNYWDELSLLFLPVSLFFKKYKNKFFQKKARLGILDKRKSSWQIFFFLAPSLLVIILFTLIPFILTIQASLEEERSSFYVNDRNIGFDNYEQLVGLSHFQVGIRNTLVYSVLSVPISLVISILISSAIVHLTRKFARNGFLSVFFMPYITSSVAVATAFFYMFAPTGLINNVIGKQVPWLNDFNSGSWKAFVAILIYGVWSNLAFQILILTTAMLGVEKNLYKSASIDGSSKIKQFFKITLPSINRSLNFLITIGIIGAIKVFPLALFNNVPENAQNANGSTLMLFIYSFTLKGQYGFSGAASILLFSIGIGTSIVLNLSTKLTIKGFVKLGDYRVNKKINAIK